MKTFRWIKRLFFFRTVAPIDHRGRVAGRAVKGRKVRNRRFRWIALSPYGTKLVECDTRRQAIRATVAYFKGF